MIKYIYDVLSKLILRARDTTHFKINDFFDTLSEIFYIS